MATSTKTQVEALEVRRTFKAQRQRVFDAWTRPEELTKWSAPGPIVPELAEVDLRVGGKYRINMRSPDGTAHRAVGSYREVDPPRRLVYTWTWETDADPIDTLVTVEFHDRGGSTEVVLRHEGFPSAAKRDGHDAGWIGCFDKLGTLLAGER
jgi:uncharacterized protein YndB with AHSA1/START domain